MINDVDLDMTEAGEKLERDLCAIFSRPNAIPADTVADVDHSGYTEDGRTFVLWCTTTTGDHLIVSATPGAPLTMTLLDRATGMVRN